MSYRVGLTGGIGSGKSTVAALFQELGISVIDSDVISHRLTQADGEAIPLIRTAFGPEYVGPDGAMDRGRMRNLILTDPAAKLRLEAILHPLIRASMLAEADSTPRSPYLLLVVPLLFESKNYRELMQRTLVVDCTEEAQVARAMSRSGLAEQAVRAFMARQISRAERLKLADDIIRNDGKPAELRPQVLQLHEFYLRRSSESPAIRP
jgi:dephospho-CoA kinase